MARTARRATVRIGTWNTDWAGRKPAARDHVREKLAEPSCNILCVTEGSARLLPQDEYVIDAGIAWGYQRRKEAERKVLLWSREPWTNVDCVGAEALPGGRFVTGVTQTPVGPLTIVGVCIPWYNAHVSNGRKDRQPWQDHRLWIETFTRLPCRKATERTIILGDFNQSIPRCPRMGVPEDLHLALLKAFQGFTIATRGELPGTIDLAIDHIACTPDLVPMGNIKIWPKRNDDGQLISDHFGVRADFSRTNPQHS